MGIPAPCAQAEAQEEKQEGQPKSHGCCSYLEVQGSYNQAIAVFIT